MGFTHAPAERPGFIERSGFSAWYDPQKILGGILLCGLLVRVWLCFFTHLPHLYKDSYEYVQQADTLLAGGYTNYFPNGYPAMLAVLKLIGGEHMIGLLLCLNILLSVLAVWFVYDIAVRTLERRSIALIAAVLVAFFPTQLNYVRWVSTEVPTEFFMLGAFFFYYRKKNWLTGLFFGLATIVRTDEAPVFIGLIILEIFWQRKFNLRLLAGAFLPILLVGSYCWVKTGNFSIAGHGKVNIIYSVTASGGYVDWYLQDKHPEIKTTGQAVQMYLDHMKAEPAGFMRQKAANLWELWGFYPSSSDGNRNWVSRLGIGLGNAFMLFFGFYAWWKNRKIFAVFVLMLPFAVATPLHTLLLALPRYTYPVEPFMLVLAAWTIHRIIAPQTSAPKIAAPRVAAS
jgi:hypothetical protein